MTPTRATYPNATAQTRIVSGGPFGRTNEVHHAISNTWIADGFLSSSPTTPASQSGLCGRCPSSIASHGHGVALILEVARGGLAVPCSALMVLMAKARFARAFAV